MKTPLDERLAPYVRGKNERGEPIVDVSAMADEIDKLRGTTPSTFVDVSIDELVDDTGYPTDKALDIITNWQYTDGLRELFDFIETIWWSPEWGWGVEETDDVIRYNISTGGWSGNDYVCWQFTWQQSRRGGHYIFEVKKEKQTSLPELTISFTGKALVVVESNWGPIEFSMNDIDSVTELVRLVLGDTGSLKVGDAYTDDEQKTLESLLRRIND
jgi:hypothetical protein